MGTGSTQIAIFRPRRSSMFKTAAISAAGAAVILVGSLWYSGPPASWQAAVGVVPLSALAMFGIIWGARLLRARHETVTIFTSGLQGPSGGGNQAFCAWKNISEARFVRDGDYVLVSRSITLPRELLDDPSFVRAIDERVPEGSPLSLALRDAGA
jgi:hypothetical protein